MSMPVKTENLIKLEPSWLEHLEEEFSKDYMQSLRRFLLEEKSLYKIYPPSSEIFNAFSLTPFDRVKVVIIGQDPYHGANQANGLCFSVSPGTKLPPSLQNIFKEIKQDINCEIGKSGDLTNWAKQGVLLLNATLTVRAD